MPTRRLTAADVEAIREEEPPHRLCLAQHPKIKLNEVTGECTIGLRFDSVGELFTAETRIRLRDGRYGPWLKLSDKKDVERAVQWQRDRAHLVFMRDGLDSSIALGFNLADEGVYTDLGRAEHDAKNSGDKGAIAALVDACAAAITSIPFYKRCNYICAVPPSPDKEWDLPTALAARLARRCAKVDISSKVRFSKPKQSIKALALAEKWAALEAGGLRVDANLSRKNVILIDDKYQSGTTGQFVASKLYEAGASEVHGLFCVKTWRDTDNQ